MSLRKIICALCEGLSGLDRLDRELRHWRWTLCFWAGLILGVFLFYCGSGILAMVAFVVMLGVGVWWDW